MNIIEALKTKKRIRQKSKGVWLDPKEGRWFSTDHILADDWEVETTPVTITRAQLEEAYLSALEETNHPDSYRLGTVVECMIKRLGL